MVCLARGTHIVESPNTSTYLLMSIQDLCSSLNQEDPVEIQAILEVIVTRLVSEVYSIEEKKNVRLRLYS